MNDPKDIGLKQDSGRLFIVSAPSGAGKTTLCHEVLKRFPGMVYSISHTTRKPRHGETDTVDYFFISKKEFLKRIEEDAWAEWAEVHGNFYGTSREFLEASLSAGSDILLDIDVQGALNIISIYPGSISIFIMPPSLEALKERLKHRGADDERTIEKRLINAVDEMKKKDLYMHVIINDRLQAAIEEMVGLINQYN